MFPNVKVEAPSNIAFLKYWGKADPEHQWPLNSSLSMTLSKAKTSVWAEAGSPTPAFKADPKSARVLRFLERLRALHFAGAPELNLRTQNHFPMGVGIASSASAFAAITIAAVAVWTQSTSFAELSSKSWTLERLADLARLGSGSAGRSLWGGYVLWDKGQALSEQRSAPLNLEWPLRDTIVIIDSQEKSVSSSQGHLLAKTSPFIWERLEQVNARLPKFKAALEAKDLAQLGPLLEEEALCMHRIMESCEPPLLYAGPATKKFLEAFKQYRHKNGLAAYFTLDAGSTVHIISEEAASSELQSWLNAQFPQYPLLTDHCGQGPQLEPFTRANSI